MTGFDLPEAAEDGALRIGASGIAALDQLARHLGIDELAIHNAVATDAEAGSATLVSGHAQLGGGLWAAKLTVGGADAPAAQLHLQATTSQTIAQIFGATQPQSSVAGTDGYLQTVPSVLASLVIDNPVLTVGQHGGTFTGAMAVDQKRDSYSLAPYTPLPISSSVALTGTWSGPQTGASFTLCGSSLSNVTLPGFITDFGLQLSNEYDVHGGTSGPLVSGASFYLKLGQSLGGAVLTVPLLYNDAFWTGTITFPTPITLEQGFDELAALLGPDAAGLIALPPGLDLFSSFGLSGMQIGLDPGGPGEAPSLAWIGVSVASEATWQPPIPKIGEVSKVGAVFQYAHGGEDTPSTLMGALHGAVALGDADGTQLTLSCVAEVPNFSLSISQLPGETVDFGAFLSNILPGTALPAGWKVQLSNFSARAEMEEREFAATMDLTGDCPIASDVALTQLQATIDVSQSGATGLVLADLTFGTGDGALVFEVTAEYAGSAEGWTFAGGLPSGKVLAVADFVQSLTGDPAPGWLSDMALQIDTLWLSYSTGPGNPYTAKGSIQGQVPLESVFGFDIQIAASAHIERAAGGAVTKGMAGSFVIGDLTVSCGVEFADAAVWEFQVLWHGVTFDAVTVAMPDDTGTGTHNAVRITLSGLTLGDIVTRMIAMIDPNLDVTLDAPWDVLNDIDLSRARFTIDPKYSRLSVDIEVGLDLGFIDIERVGLIYDRGAPGGSVRYEVQGDFLGTSYGDGNPISWDAINDSPPTVPAQGTQLLDVHYLGLGQHVGLGGTPTTIPDVLSDMQQILVPADGQSNPLAGCFDPDMGWLAGIDMTLMGFISLKMVFADPQIYGLHVGLNGDEAKALNGLAIDLTYRKVSNDVGVFHVELTLPDAYRQIQLGAVSVTLGIIDVDVYTDGGFEIDLGFPRGGDYSRAFTVEAGPFLGRGGIYFGVLESGGSSRVPAATNGGFAPVIEAGIGFAGGIGRDFNKGPLSAGAYVQIEAIFEGALAWFHPTDASQPTDMYYYCRATVGIAGAVYGSVDFGIVSASVMISAQATATVVLEAYRATLIELDAEVSVSCSVHFLFFHVSFDFHMELDLSFTIGSDSDAPWILQSGSSNAAPQQLDRIYARPRRTARQAVATLHRSFLAQHLLGAPALTLNWNSGRVKVFGTPRTVDMTIASAITLESPAVEWTPPAPAAPTTPPIMTFVTATLPADANAEDPIDILIEAVLRWALAAAGMTSTVDVGALAELDVQMRSADTQAAFTWATLSEFFSYNVDFCFHDFSSAVEASGTMLPMLPVFTRTDGAATEPAITYWDQTPIGSGYETALAAWIAKLSVAPAPDAATVGLRVIAPSDSFPRMTFRSYFLMMAKAAVSEALTASGAWKTAIPEGGSLATVAATFPATSHSYVKTAGDTIDAAAASFGVTVDELVFLEPQIRELFEETKPGDTILISVGVTPESIASGNPGLTLTTNPTEAQATAVPCDLAPLPWQIGAGDTLAAITSGTVADWLQATGDFAIADRIDLLQPQAPLALPGYLWAEGAPLDNATRAAILFVRLIDTDPANSVIRPELVAWCSTQIAALNPSLQWNSDGSPKQPPAAISVPTDQKGGKGPWTLFPGDTLSRIARAVALVLDPTAAADFATFAAALAAHNQPGAPVALPPGTATVTLANESLRQLSARLLIGFDPAFASIVGPAKILAPLRTVTPPESIRNIPLGTTLQTIATSFGLSLEAVGQRIGGLAGVFAADTPISIAHAASLPVDALVAATIAQGGARIRGQLSRFMLQGLRVPAPTSDGSGMSAKLAGFSELNGLQAELSQFAVTGDPNFAYRASFGFSEAGQPWINFASGGESMTTGLSADDVSHHTPAPVLTPSFVPEGTPASAMPLTKQTPTTWNLSQRLLWLVANWPTDLLGTAPSGAVPGLWPLPDTLLTANSVTPADNPLSLQQIDTQAAPGTSSTPIASWCFATRLDVTIRQTGTPEIYELLTVDSSQRELLLDLWQHGTGLVIELLYLPPGSSGTPTGLASPALGGDTTVLLQSNLSTESRDASDLLGAPAPAAPPAAAITDANNFLQLVWECSMVGGGGFWLRVGTADKKGLPSSIFGSNGRAVLTLLVAQSGQSAQAQQTLQSYHNYAIIGDQVAPATSHVFVQSTLPAFDRALPVIATGKAAFEMTMAQPVGGPARASDGTVTTDPQLIAQQLFQLLGYRIAASDNFIASEIGLPIAPQSIQSNGSPQWVYSATLPLHRYAAHPTAPAVPGLPAPGDDPYAAIVLDSAANPPAAAAAAVELWFQDVHGNATQGAPDDTLAVPAAPAPPAATYTLVLPSLYTDPVPGIAQWPSAASTFAVSGTAADPQLDVHVELQLSAYSPARSQLPSALVPTIQRHRDQYAQAWYQLHRPDFTATLSSSLQAPDSEGHPAAPIALDLAQLKAFVGSTYAYLAAAAQMTDVQAASSCATIGGICKTYGVDYADLAAVNGALTLTALSHTLQIPVFALATQGKSTTDLCGASAASALVSPLNADLPLTPALEIALPLPVRRTALPAGLPDDQRTLTAAASRFGCSVAGLATASSALPSLAPGIVMTSGTATVTTSAALNTLDAVAAWFSSNGTPTQLLGLARANADVPGLLADKAALAIATYITLPGDTLAANHSGATQIELAPVNTATANLFPAGTPIFVQEQAPGADDFARPLTQLASVHAVSVEQLLAYWSAAPVDTTQFVLPGLAAIPTTALTPYIIRTGDTLTALAPLFDAATPPSLVTANWDMPAMLAPGIDVTIGSAHATTQTGDSFASLAGRFTTPATPTELATAIAGTANILSPGALLLCPMATAAAAVDLTSLAGKFGLDAKSLALANAGFAGWIKPDAVFSLGGKTVPADGKPGNLAGYSLAGIVSAFAVQGVATSVGALLDTCLTQPIVAAGARLLLPPRPIDLIEPLTANAHYPQPIFPLTVSISLSRDSRLVEPTLLVNSDASHSATVQISPKATPQTPNPTSNAPPSLNFTDFAAALETALPQLRVCSGAPDASGASRARLWAVSFGAGELSKVSVAGPAALYGLRPLYPQPVSRDSVSLAQRATLGGTAQSVDIRNADVETWAKGFLADIGTFLEAGQAFATYDAAAVSYAQVLASKAQLATAIAAGLENLFEAGASPGRTAARAKLEQKLLSSLPSAWDWSAVVQYPVTATAPTDESNIRIALMPKLDSTDPAQTAISSRTILGGDTIDFSGAKPFVSLAATITPGVDPAIDLTIDAAFPQVEFGIEEIQATGYEDSQWLSFVRPLSQNPPPGFSVALGTPRVPVLARSYPVAPLPLSQSTRSDPRAPSGWQGAPYWAFDLSFSYAAAPQDQIVFGAIFNQSQDPAKPAPVDAGLFEALATYEAQRASIWADLAGADVATGAQDFAQQVKLITAQWASHWPDPARDSRVARLFRVGAVAEDAPPTVLGLGFIATLEHGASFYNQLILQPAVAGQAAEWPMIAVDAGGMTHQLVVLESSTATCTYGFPPGVTIPIGASITYHVSIGGLHIASHQEAVGAIAILRNAALLGPGGPAILEDFVYRAPPLTFPVTVAPYLTFAAPFPAGDWEGLGVSSLADILATLLTDGTMSLQTVSIEARAGSEAISPALPLRLPLFYDPDATYPGTLAADITRFIDDWAKQWTPPAEGFWEIAVTAYSTLTDRPDEPLMVASLAFSRALPNGT